MSMSMSGEFCIICKEDLKDYYSILESPSGNLAHAKCLSQMQKYEKRNQSCVQMSDFNDDENVVSYEYKGETFRLVRGRRN